MTLQQEPRLSWDLTLFSSKAIKKEIIMTNLRIYSCSFSRSDTFLQHNKLVFPEKVEYFAELQAR